MYCIESHPETKLNLMVDSLLGYYSWGHIDIDRQRGHCIFVWVMFCFNRCSNWDFTSQLQHNFT